jgi:hypothetical protein
MKIDAVVKKVGFHWILSFPRKRESSNDFALPRLCENSVWTPAAVYPREGGDRSDRIFDFLRDR